MRSSKKKRARMAAEGTPDRKRKRTKSKPLKDMSNTLLDTQGQEGTVTSGKVEKLQDEDKAVITTLISGLDTDNSVCPSMRWGHTMCLTSAREAVLIGGQRCQQQFCKDSIWTLDIERSSWDVLQTTTGNTSHSTAHKPEVRMGHTAVYDPTVCCIYVFGGSKNLKWFSDIHVLDVEEGKWQLIKANGRAPQRAYHSATLYRHELWIFGGVYPRPDPQPDGCSNQIYVFNPMDECWYSPILMGTPPAPRSGHSATLLRDKMILFGGWDAPVCFNDFHMLDLSLIEWSQPTVTGAIPSPRSWHASCALSGNRVLIHGGYNGNDALNDSFIFNYGLLSCSSVKHDKCVLRARTGHTVVCLPYKHENKNTDEVLVFGGGDNNDNFFQDLRSITIPFECNVFST